MTLKQIEALLEKADGHTLEFYESDEDSTVSARCTHKDCDFSAMLFGSQWIVLDGNVDSPKKERLVRQAEDNFATNFKEALRTVVNSPAELEHPCQLDVDSINYARQDKNTERISGLAMVTAPIDKCQPCCKNWQYPELCSSVKHRHEQDS